MKKFAFKSIRSKLTFWFVVLGLIPLFIGIVITYHQQVRSIEQETFEKLITIRDLKVERLENWLNQRTGDVKTSSTDNELVDLQTIINKEHKDQTDLKIYKNIRGLLNRYLKNYDAYDEIFIINPRTGTVEISTNANLEGTDQSDDPYFTRPIKTRELFIKNIYYSKSLARNTMTFSIPIFCTKHVSHHIVGILVARVDLKNSLYALLQDRVGLGKTGETLIVNKDVLALNELRWHENAPLKLQINADPAVMASQGQTGIVETTDYRDEKILAAYTYIPETGWGFVAKQDLSELNAPIKSMVVNLLILSIGALITILILTFFIARTIAAPVIDMAATAGKMQKGDLSVRNRITGADELAVLAETFNTMAGSVESQVELREINDDITQTLVDVNDLPAFRTNILKKLVAVTGSQMGAYFVLNRDTNIFEHFTSIGITPDLLKPFDGSALEGELGMVVEATKITHITDIPEDSIFTFRTFTGTIIPKEIISIPIIVDGVVSGIVSLASIKPYPRKVLDIMKQPWTTGISTALSNMQANDETKRLAAELEGKNQELQAQTEELQSQSEELQQSAEELQEQNVELDTQRQQVEDANRMKSQFLSNMSHELRTPLNSVMALSQVLIMQAKAKLSPEEGNYLEIIERNGKNLLALINDILDLSKIEAGRMDVNPQPFSLAMTLENIVESITPIAAEKQIQIHQEVPGDLPLLESDEIRVSQILQNLIGNGVKFTDTGNVTASVQSDKEKITVRIVDTGTGIAENDLPYIFDEFRQVDGSSSRRHEGTGLGLAIARKTARMLGGDITVTSAPEKGSTFTLTLPIVWQGLAPVYEPIVSREPSTVKPERKTILVVDDEPEMASMVSNYLLQEGYNTLTATSGPEALKLAARERPFAITLDIIMPDMDGWEVLQRLKKNPETRDIPTIIVSVSEEKETGFALGAAGYISKPVSKQQIISEIERILRDLEEDPKHSGVKQPTVSPRILIVDDNETVIIQVKAVLESAGYVADVARGGQEALDYVSHTVPDGIILDLMMPKIDGLAVLEKIRGTKATVKIPVLILTAKDLTPEDFKKLSANHVQQLVQKGDIDREDLLARVRSMVEGKSQTTFETETLTPGTPTHKPVTSQFENTQIRKPGREPATILVVEDNPDNMITIKAVFQERYHILEATDGQAGLQMAEQAKPDLILLDMALPRMDGFTVVRNLKDKTELRNIPVISMTAQVMKGDREKILAAGCDDYIAKPIDPESSLIKINKWLKG